MLSFTSPEKEKCFLYIYDVIVKQKKNSDNHYLSLYLTTRHVPLLTTVYAHPQMNHGSHVKALLEAGALPDAVDIYGDTPLHMAVSYGYSDLIPIFVSLVDPESLTRTLGTHNMYGQRPIDMAQVCFVPSLSRVAPAPSIPLP